jgi:hypothetical protein
MKKTVIYGAEKMHSLINSIGIGGAVERTSEISKEDRIFDMIIESYEKAGSND